MSSDGSQKEDILATVNARDSRFIGESKPSRDSQAVMQRKNSSETEENDYLEEAFEAAVGEFVNLDNSYRVESDLTNLVIGDKNNLAKQEDKRQSS